MGRQTHGEGETETDGKKVRGNRLSINEIEKKAEREEVEKESNKKRKSRPEEHVK